MLVGADRQEFTAPKELLCEFMYFRKALSRYFKEGEENPATIVLFQRWLTGRYLIRDCDFETKDVEAIWQALLGLWSFVEMTMIPSLQDAAINTMIQLEFKTNSAPQKTIGIWSDLGTQSKLRQFLVDLYFERLRLPVCVAVEAKPENHDEELLTLFSWKSTGPKGYEYSSQRRCDYCNCCSGGRCDEMYAW